jgi:hypothetical protein
MITLWWSLPPRHRLGPVWLSLSPRVRLTIGLLERVYDASLSLLGVGVGGGLVLCLLVGVTVAVLGQLELPAVRRRLVHQSGTLHGRHGAILLGLGRGRWLLGLGRRRLGLGRLGLTGLLLQRRLALKGKGKASVNSWSS